MRGTKVNGVEYSPDGTRIATANDWGEVQLWDAATLQPVSPVLHHATSAGSVAFCHDSRLLLSNSTDRSARLWDARDGAVVGEPMPHADGVRSVYFDRPGGRVVTASNDGTARVWEARTGLPLSEPMLHGALRVPLAEFSPNGHFARTETGSTPDEPSRFFLWAVPPSLPPGAATPDWLLDLATICAGQSIDSEGRVVDAADALAKIDDVRRTLAALPDDAAFVEWGRWILAHRATRSIAPGFTITPAEADALFATMKTSGALSP